MFSTALNDIIKGGTFRIKKVHIARRKLFTPLAMLKLSSRLAI